MKPPATRQLYIAGSLDDALDAYQRFGDTAEFFAGGTWIMRADHREEFDPRSYVAIAHLDGMTKVDVTEDRVEIGACVTHAKLAQAIAGLPDLAGLNRAAASSANPAIRSMATVGGNICAAAFAAPDLVPALLCLGATVETAVKDERRTMLLNEFLAVRCSPPTGIVTKVVVPRHHERRSAHARLPLKKAGDYPVAIVSVAIQFDADGTIANPRIFVGSVENVARRWVALEQAVTRLPVDPESIAARSATLCGDFRGRDGVEAPGWYRVKVLPALVRLAFESLLTNNMGA